MIRGMGQAQGGCYTLTVSKVFVFYETNVVNTRRSVCWALSLMDKLQ